MLLTSYEVLLKDKATFRHFCKGGKWPVFQTVIVDEAHRLKGLKSSTREVICGLDYRWLLLLTGISRSHGMGRSQVFVALPPLRGKCAPS